MASALYNSYKQGLLTNSPSVVLSTADIRVALVHTGTYTFSAAHTMRSDLSGVVALSGALASKTTTNGVFDAADINVESVTGNSVGALVLYRHTGDAATDNLIAYLDGFTAVTPNGGDILIEWDGGADRIFAF